jgi:hypothetical protein
MEAHNETRIMLLQVRAAEALMDIIDFAEAQVPPDHAASLRATLALLDLTEPPEGSIDATVRQMQFAAGIPRIVQRLKDTIARAQAQEPPDGDTMLSALKLLARAEAAPHLWKPEGGLT